MLVQGDHQLDTQQVAVNPLSVVAVIVQFQGVTQVTNHVLLTVAIDVLLDVHDTVLVESAGVNVAVICDVCHTLLSFIELLSNDIAVAGILGRTSCVHTSMRLILYQLVIKYIFNVKIILFLQ